MGFFKEQLEGLGIGETAGAAARLSFFGIWAQHTWIFWMNTNNALLPAWLPWQAIYLALAVALCAAALLARRLASGSGDAVGNRRGRNADWLAGGLAAAAPCLVLLSTALPHASGAVAALALAVGVIGYAWLQLRWGLFYAQLSIRQSIAFLFTGGMAGIVAKYALGLLPLAASAPCTALIGLGSAAMVGTSLANVPHNPAARIVFTRKTLPALWKVAAVIALFSIATASMLSIAPVQGVSDMPGISALRSLIQFVLCACVLLYVFQFDRAFDFVGLWRLIVVALGADFLVNIIVPNSLFQVMFAGVALNFIVLLVWLTIADVARHSDMPAYELFALGWGLYALSYFVGWLLTSAFGITGDAIAYFAVMLFVIGVPMSLLLEPRDPNLQSIFSDFSREAVAEPTDFADIDSRCAAVGAAHGLTPREIEVMQLLCKGRSKAYIAETLFVTENTVKGHAKRVYAKLDVHSKQELQQLIGI